MLSATVLILFDNCDREINEIVKSNENRNEIEYDGSGFTNEILTCSILKFA